MADFNEIYDRYFSDAYRYLALRVYDNDRIKEMMQKLFLYVSERADTEPIAISPFLPFMYNFCWKMVKDEPVETLKSIPAGPNRPAFYTDTFAVSGGESSVIPQSLLELVSSLTIEEREILWLKFFEELTDLEITKVIHMHPKEAPRRIYNALQKTREILSVSSTSASKRHINYFGNVNGFFDNIKSTLNIPEDLNLKESIKTNITSKEKKDYDYVLEISAKTESEEKFDKEAAFPEEIEENVMSAGEIWRRIQGVIIAFIAIAVIVFTGAVLYFSKTNIYSKVVYSGQFNQEEKTAFNKEIIDKILPERDFLKAEVKKIEENGLVVLTVDNKDNDESFVYKNIGDFKWTTEAYQKTENDK